MIGGIGLSVGELSELDGRLLVIFDGECGLCNRSVRWFLVRDERDRLRFAPSESAKVAEVLARHETGATPGAGAPNSILVVRNAGGANEEMIVRSGGVLAMLAELPRPWPVVARILGWIPRGLRDLGYQGIARLRYRIWGRLESCPVPTATERGRFL